jgi:uncharacterized lipoprotein NlpE involved in copper resistance
MMLQTRINRTLLMAGLLLLTMITMVSATACKAGVKKDANADETTAADPAHNSRNSLDYLGSYYGVLPAADAEGLETFITLREDGSYEMITRFLGKDDYKNYEDYGKYTWNEAGNTITLEGLPKPNQYFVGENNLTHLDMDGKKIKGSLAEKYVLIKLMD